MKTAEELAREYADETYPSADSNDYSRTTAEEWDACYDGYVTGYNEAMRWRDPKMELPAVYNGGSAYENKDLIIVKLSKYDSYEFAVLIKVNGKLMWDIPDMGTFELQDIIGWRPIE